MNAARVYSIILVVLGLVCSACKPASSPEPQRLTVFVSILPQAYFVERVGRPHVDVEVLVGPGQSPATYEPTPKQATRLDRSQVYFRVGVPFERAFLDKVQRTFEGLSVVDTREGVPLRTFGGHHHGTETADPHIWLDPGRVKIQAKTICRELSRVDPEHAGTFQRNLEVFLSDLDELDRWIARMLAPLKGTKVYVFHPSYGYFCDAYGLVQVPVEVEGKGPSARQLTALIEQAREEGVKVLFVQPQFAKKDAEAIAAALEGRAVSLDPLPRDYIREMRKMATTLKHALTGGG